MENFIKKYRNWQYKNSFIFVLSLILLIIFIDSPLIRNTVNIIGNFGYIGAFLTGIFFVSIFTAAPATVVLYNFANKLNPYEVALLAGIGAVVGDFLIFKALKSGLFEELQPLVKKTDVFKKIGVIFRTPYFSWIIPIIGAILVASPVPDEFGIGMLGLSRIKTWQFILITFALNALGIFLIVSFAAAK